MSTFPEVDLKNALVLYATQNVIDLTEDDCWRLVDLQGNSTGARTGYQSANQIEWLHQSIAKPTENQLITLYDDWIAANEAIAILQQQIAVVENNAKTQASAIPNWASWTEAQALSWHDTNVANAIAPIANLTDAKAVLTQLATENRALVRMVIALRNKAFPDLQE